METGSRFGLFSYSAIYHECKHITGLDIEDEYISSSISNFVNVGVPHSKFSFILKDAVDFDYTTVDVALCLGLLYNMKDNIKHLLLDAIKKCDLILMEFWCCYDDDPSPHTIKYIQENSPNKQYKPNYLQVQKMFREGSKTN